jgi:hypothetical protein
VSETTWQIIPRPPDQTSHLWGLIEGSHDGGTYRSWRLRGRRLILLKINRDESREARLLAGPWVLRVGNRPTHAAEIRNCSGGFECEHHRWHLNLEIGQFEWM